MNLHKPILVALEYHVVEVSQMQRCGSTERTWKLLAKGNFGATSLQGNLVWHVDA